MKEEQTKKYGAEKLHFDGLNELQIKQKIPLK
jgi:hypothetical protein